MSDIDLSAGGLSDLGGQAALLCAVAAWADRAAALGGRAPETLPPRFSSTWKRLSGWSVPPHRKLSGANTEPLIRNSFSTEQFVSRRGVGGSISVFLSQFITLTVII